jgi:hypothetical protein
MQNLKIAASIYSEAGSVSELEKQISVKSAAPKGLSPENIDRSKLQSEHKALISQKEALRKQFKDLEKEVYTLQNKQNSFIQYFNKSLIPNKKNTPEL